MPNIDDTFKEKIKKIALTSIVLAATATAGLTLPTGCAPGTSTYNSQMDPSYQQSLPNNKRDAIYKESFPIGPQKPKTYHKGKGSKVGNW